MATPPSASAEAAWATNLLDLPHDVLCSIVALASADAQPWGKKEPSMHDEIVELKRKPHHSTKRNVILGSALIPLELTCRLLKETVACAKLTHMVLASTVQIWGERHVALQLALLRGIEREQDLHTGDLERRFGNSSRYPYTYDDQDRLYAYDHTLDEITSPTVDTTSLFAVHPEVLLPGGREWMADARFRADKLDAARRVLRLCLAELPRSSLPLNASNVKWHAFLELAQVPPGEIPMHFFIQGAFAMAPHSNFINMIDLGDNMDESAARLRQYYPLASAANALLRFTELNAACESDDDRETREYYEQAKRDEEEQWEGYEQWTRDERQQECEDYEQWKRDERQQECEDYEQWKRDERQQEWEDYEQWKRDEEEQECEDYEQWKRDEKLEAALQRLQTQVGSLADMADKQAKAVKEREDKQAKAVKVVPLETEP